MASSNLRKAIEILAADLALGVLRALKNASLADLMGDDDARKASTPARPAAAGPAPKRSRGGKRARRSSSDLEGAIAKILSTLRAAGAKGLRAEVLRKRVGLGRRQMMRPIALALSSRRMKKTGQKRATTYFAP